MSVRWLPFFLRPNMPPDGHPKGPGRRVGPRLKEAGAAVGIDFTGATDRYPNSTLAHVALAHVLALEDSGAAPPGTQNRLQEEIFHGYFTAGIYPDAAALAAMAGKVGIDAKDMRAVLDGSTASGAAANVEQEAAAISRSGVSGVPYFFFNKHPAFSGARDPATIIDCFRQVTQQQG